MIFYILLTLLYLKAFSLLVLYFLWVIKTSKARNNRFITVIKF